jgi:hypothetical protein
MSNIQSLNIDQLRRVIAIKEEMAALNSQLDSILGEGPQAGEIPSPFSVAEGTKRRHVSAEGRARIAAAARARWAKFRGGSGGVSQKPAKTGKRRLSAAGRAAIIAATKARWARVRAEKGAA